MARALLTWTVLAALTLASPAAVAAVPQTNDSGAVFAAAGAELERGNPRAALAVADACTDPRLRAQAQLYVRHHSGDISGALEAGLMGLEEVPQDLWLLERSSSLALDLGATELALKLLPRLDEALDASSESANWQERIAALHERADAMQSQRERANRSLSFAKTTVLCCGFLVLVSFAALRAKTS